MENVKRESAVEVVEDNQVSRMSFSDEETDGEFSSGKKRRSEFLNHKSRANYSVFSWQKLMIRKTEF